MNPNKTVHELDRLMHEIHQYEVFKPEYKKRMMELLHEMCILTLLEFTGGQARPKVKIDTMSNLLRITKSSLRQSK